MQQVAGVEDCLGHVAGQQPERVEGMQEAGERERGVAAIGIDGEIREHVGGGDPDQRAGRVHLLFRQTHVGALLDQLRRQAHRQVLRQLQRLQVERLEWLLARITAEQRGQQIARDGQLLLQRRQGCFLLRQDRLLRGQVDAAGVTGVELLAQDIERLSC